LVFFCQISLGSLIEEDEMGGKGTRYCKYQKGIKILKRKHEGSRPF
jgi:hypothetical protein